MKQISRRSFLKGAAASALTASVLGQGVLSSAEEAAAEEAKAEEPAIPETFTDGVYYTNGMSMHGHVTVKTTIAEGAISDVTVVDHNESYMIGEYAVKTVPKKIVETQKVDVDGVTGATFTSFAIKSAVMGAIEKAGGKLIDFMGYKAPEIEESEENVEADVIIVGAGPAGLMAAWELAEGGKKVVIFEKMPFLGGCTSVTGCGIYTQETKIQKAWGLDNVYAGHSTFEKRLASYGRRLDPESPYYNPEMPFIDAMLRNSSAAVDKMLEIGVPFCSMGDMAIPVFAPGEFSQGGRVCIDIVSHYLTTQLGVVIYTESPVQSLTMDGDKVVGCTAKSKAGVTYHATAKAVILASGGYIMNREMMEQYQPNDLKFMIMGMPWCTGDGMLMAKDAGAAWICMDQGVTSHYHAGKSLAEISYIHYVCKPGVVVNGFGNRFVSESLSYVVALKQYKEQESTDFWWVFDENGRQCMAPRSNQYNIDYRFLLETGDIIVGSDYKDLAEKANLPGLVESLEKVNECVETGAEDEFGNASLKHLDINGPMYACKIIPAPYVAQGGVMVDVPGHVQREDGSFIQGLYAAGDVTGCAENRDGHYYVAGLTQAFGYGKVVGDTVLAEL
ncbi:MAG: FAD-dependent oxidoreductase [Lachnospiraceae bacterium]|nr:FAD-dependent oxidoreductase [Lachnospiraceae bacterium]